RVTTGRAMPDDTPGLDGGIVLMSAEDDLADTIRPRLDAAKANPQRVLALQAVGEVDTETGKVQDRPGMLPRDLEAIREAVAQIDARLIVIDPLMAYLDSSVNSYRDQDVRLAFRPLAQLAQETGCAVVVVRHLNKGAGGNPLYRGGGSIGI